MILTEKARSSLKLNEHLTDGDELNAVQNGEACFYYYFVKPPVDPKIEAPFKL
jgi:hypothetical protein